MGPGFGSGCLAASGRERWPGCGLGSISAAPKSKLRPSTMPARCSCAAACRRRPATTPEHSTRSPALVVAAERELGQRREHRHRHPRLDLAIYRARPQRQQHRADRQASRSRSGDGGSAGRSAWTTTPTASSFPKAAAAPPDEAGVAFGAILGTGVGGGIAFAGRPHDGRNAIAGEWGHTPMPWLRDDEKAERCYCGRNGCIETFLCGPQLREQYRKRTGRTLDPPEINAAAEVRRCRRGGGAITVSKTA